MSPLDATFLHVEDGVSHMHIASTLIFEGPAPRYEELLERIEGKLPLVPRYRKVVRPVPFALGRPVWVDDSQFNLEYHVRHSALPPPGGDEELRRLVGRVMSQRLDRDRPLWELWMVEGLADVDGMKRWAIISKVHHCMVDGVSGSELLTVTLDVLPDPPRAVLDDWHPEPPPSPASLAVQAIGNMATSPYQQMRAARAATRVPRNALTHAFEAAKGLGALAGLARPTAPSSLNGPIGPQRRYAWAEATVDEVKLVRKAFGGTFNDVVLAVITAGFASLLSSRGEVTETVRTMVPVSVRPRDERGTAVGDGNLANRVSAMFAELPVGLADPVERLHALSGQLSSLKESNQAVAGEALTSLSGFAPPALLALGARIATKTAQRNVNTVTTNVPGPQMPLYCVGRRMISAYPYVPLAGQVRIGVAIFSYDGKVTFGVTGDYDSAPDIGILCRGIEEGMAELVALAG